MRLTFCWIGLHSWGPFSEPYYEMYEINYPPGDLRERHIWVSCKARICNHCGVARIVRGDHIAPYVKGDETDGRIFSPVWCDIEQN